MAEVRTLTVVAAEDGVRLDRWFRRRWPHLSNVQIHKLARSGQIRVDGARAKAETRLAAGAQVRVPPLPDAPPQELRDALSSRDRGLRARPGALRGRRGAGAEQAGGPGGAGRHQDPPPHRPAAGRLGRRDRSGRGWCTGSTATPPACWCWARRPAAAAKLAGAFARRRAQKTYWAIVAGMPKPAEGVIDLPLAKTGFGDREMVAPADPKDPKAEPAETEFVTISRAAQTATWLALRPVTGRTHQLRAHMLAIGHPILGDPKYRDRGVGGAVGRAEAAAARAPHRAAAPKRRRAGAGGAAQPRAARRLRPLRVRGARGAGGPVQMTTTRSQE